MVRQSLPCMPGVALWCLAAVWPADAIRHGQECEKLYCLHEDSKSCKAPRYMRSAACACLPMPPVMGRTAKPIPPAQGFCTLQGPMVSEECCLCMSADATSHGQDWETTLPAQGFCALQGPVVMMSAACACLLTSPVMGRTAKPAGLHQGSAPCKGSALTGSAACARLQKWHVVQRAHLGTVRGCTSTQRTFSLVSKGRLYSNFRSRSKCSQE